MELIWESWKFCAFWKLWSPVPQGLFTLNELMQIHPVGTTAHWGRTWRTWGTEPPRGLRQGSLTSSRVTSHWPQLDFAVSASCKHPGQKCSHRPRLAGAWRLATQPFWKELCSRAPVAGVQMLLEGLDLLFKNRKRQEQKKALPVSRGPRGVGWGVWGRGRLWSVACEVLYKLCIYYFLLAIKIKCTQCFCIQYTFNPADLDFSGFKSGGELAGFPTFPSSPP